MSSPTVFAVVPKTRANQLAEVLAPKGVKVIVPISMIIAQQAIIAMSNQPPTCIVIDDACGRGHEVEILLANINRDKHFSGTATFLLTDKLDLPSKYIERTTHVFGSSADDNAFERCLSEVLGLSEQIRHKVHKPVPILILPCLT
jgi:hypothetical protein